MIRFKIKNALKTKDPPINAIQSDNSFNFVFLFVSFFILVKYKTQLFPPLELLHEFHVQKLS